MLLKEWKENVLAIKVPRVRSEIDTAKVVAIVTRPTAMYPGTNHERIEDPRIVLKYLR